MTENDYHIFKEGIAVGSAILNGLPVCFWQVKEWPFGMTAVVDRERKEVVKCLGIQFVDLSCGLQSNKFTETEVLSEFIQCAKEIDRRCISLQFLDRKSLYVSGYTGKNFLEVSNYSGKPRDVVHFNKSFFVRVNTEQCDSTLVDEIYFVMQRLWSVLSENKRENGFLYYHIGSKEYIESLYTKFAVSSDIKFDLNSESFVFDTQWYRVKNDAIQVYSCEPDLIDKLYQYLSRHIV